MGDMAEPWKSMREERQKQVREGKRVSMKYKTEADREWGTRTAYEANMRVDADTLKHLTELGLEPIRKGYASFQITHNGRVGMYYNGKRGEKVHWQNGEKVELPYRGLEDYLKEQS